MMDVRFILKLFDRTFIVKLFLLALLYSLIPLAEIYILFYLGGLVGNYLILAAAAAAGLLGVLFAIASFLKTLDKLKGKIRQGLHPADEFVHLLGILIGGIFLLTPGFFTDLVGLLLLVPGIRNALGRWLIRKTRVNLKELYEYLKLYES